MYPMEYGNAVDASVKDQASNTYFLSKLAKATPGVYEKGYTVAQKTGPDFYNKTFNLFWDITTEGQWAKKIKYTPKFGSGTGIIYNRTLKTTSIKIGFDVNKTASQILFFYPASSVSFFINQNK